MIHWIINKSASHSLAIPRVGRNIEGACSACFNNAMLLSPKRLLPKCVAFTRVVYYTEAVVTHGTRKPRKYD